MTRLYPEVKKNKGMTYIELIVVMGIFALVSSVTIFNYRKFEEKVDTKNLANDIALQIVKMQKDSVEGRVPPTGKVPNNPLTWKPSYGVLFYNTNSKNFYPFVDLNQSNIGECGVLTHGAECLTADGVFITSAVSISELRVFYVNGSSSVLSELSIAFTRPDAVAKFGSLGTIITPEVSYVQITLTSSQGVTAEIRVYASGRIQIN